MDDFSFDPKENDILIIKTGPCQHPYTTENRLSCAAGLTLPIQAKNP